MEGRAVVTIRLSSAVMNPAALVMATAQTVLPPRTRCLRCCFMAFPAFPGQTYLATDQWTWAPAGDGIGLRQRASAPSGLGADSWVAVLRGAAGRARRRL